MSEEPNSAKPDDKRGVNKATMDQPQEEFVGDSLAESNAGGSSPTPAGDRPKPETQQKDAA